MKTLTLIFYILTTIDLMLVSPPIVNSSSQEELKLKSVSGKTPIIINSNTLEIDQKKRTVTFAGGVNAVQDDIVINCDKMMVYYYTDKAKNESSIGSNRIEKIEASGNVIINIPDGNKATAGKVVFYENEGKAILTENPRIQQGPDFVEGHRITIFLNEDRSIIEGNDSKRVRATIFPKKMGENSDKE